jgi:hypothetical protein
MSVPCERGAQGAGFLGREIDDEEAVDAGGGSGLGEAVEAVFEEGVVVAEEHDGDVGLGAETGGHLQGFGERHAGVERALGGFLDDGAVGGGVGEGDAEFEDVEAGGHGGAEDLEARLGGGIAGGQVADEGFLVGGGVFWKVAVMRFMVGVGVGYAWWVGWGLGSGPVIKLKVLESCALARNPDVLLTSFNVEKYGKSFPARGRVPSLSPRPERLMRICSDSAGAFLCRRGRRGWLRAWRRRGRGRFRGRG